MTDSITYDDLMQLEQKFNDQLENIRTELEERITILEQINEPEMMDEPIMSEDEQNQILMDNTPEWTPDETYVEGQMTKHNNQLWVALPDVAETQPDDIYDKTTQTGGWIPLKDF